MDWRKYGKPGPDPFGYDHDGHYFMDDKSRESIVPNRIKLGNEIAEKKNKEKLEKYKNEDVFEIIRRLKDNLFVLKIEAHNSGKIEVHPRHESLLHSLGLLEEILQEKKFDGSLAKLKIHYPDFFHMFMTVILEID